MAMTQPLTTCEELEAMSTEEFLAWLLTSCKIDEEEYAPIRRDVRSFFLRRLNDLSFDAVAVEERYPKLSSAFLEISAEVTHE